MKPAARHLRTLILVLLFVGLSVPVGVWIARRHAEVATAGWSPLYSSRVEKALAPQRPTEVAAAQFGTLSGCTLVGATCDPTCMGPTCSSTCPETCAPTCGCQVDTIAETCASLRTCGGTCDVTCSMNGTTCSGTCEGNVTCIGDTCSGGAGPTCYGTCRSDTCEDAGCEVTCQLAGVGCDERYTQCAELMACWPTHKGLTCASTCTGNPACGAPQVGNTDRDTCAPTCASTCTSTCSTCLAQCGPSNTSSAPTCTGPTCVGATCASATCPNATCSATCAPNCQAPTSAATGCGPTGAGSADFGNAREGYPVLLKENGARHTIGGKLSLGAREIAEADGQPGAAPADNDGVWFSSSFAPGTLVTVIVDASAAGYLDAWIDWSGRRDWQGPEDQVFASRKVNPGLNILTLRVPATASAGDTFSRFRLSSQGGLAPTGAAADGEVEDYALRICQKLAVSLQTDRLVYRVGDRQTIAYSLSEEADVSLVLQSPEGPIASLGTATLPAGTHQFAGGLLPLAAGLPEGMQWIELQVTGRLSGCAATVASPFRVSR